MALDPQDVIHISPVWTSGPLDQGARVDASRLADGQETCLDLHADRRAENESTRLDGGDFRDAFGQERARQLGNHPEEDRLVTEYAPDIGVAVQERDRIDEVRHDVAT